MAIIKSYQFNDPLFMTDLAIDIQTKVYWGGHFYLEGDDSNQIPWKDFWNIVATEIDVRGATKVIINEDDSTVKFKYER